MTEPETGEQVEAGVKWAPEGENFYLMAAAFQIDRENVQSGAFPNYKAAYDAWKNAAQRTVDNAEMRFFILHAHRLLDPETGHTHDV